MGDIIDRETGEYLTVAPPRPKMPPEIAAAIVAVMSKVKQLGYDDKNPQGNYKFASIDKFLAFVGPLCADAGIFILPDEGEWKIEYKAGGFEGKQVGWLTMKYSMTIFHASGASYGPLTRNIVVLAQGPQAFGSAQSYVLKMFMRGLFQIPTGDRDDADLNAPGEPPASEPQPERKPTRQQAANPTAAAVAKDEAERQKTAGEDEAEKMRQEYGRIMGQLKATRDVSELMTLKDGTADVRAKIATFNDRAKVLLDQAFEKQYQKLHAAENAPAAEDEEIPV